MPASDAPVEDDGKSVDRPPTGVRKYRRAAGDGLGFVPWGLVPLLGMALVLIAGLGSLARTIEDSTQETARRALAEVSADWATPRVSGQWVLIEGRPPSVEAADQAIGAVRRARTSTWLGPAMPATRVRLAFAAQTPVPSASVPPATRTSERYEWIYRLSPDTITLQGRVPNDATRRLIAEAADAAFQAPRKEKIVNQLVVDPGEAPDGFSNIALRGVSAISKCNEGTASFTGAQFAVRCSLPSAERAGVDDLARTPLPYGRIGEIELLESEAVDSCDAALAALLDESRIEFDSASADITASSAFTLDSIAETARNCPGTLRIEGHTDSTGIVRDNLTLSLARADAVRAALISRGLNAERLVANGYGAGRPRDTNATAEGRARNRRIEIRVVTQSDD